MSMCLCAASDPGLVVSGKTHSHTLPRVSLCLLSPCCGRSKSVLKMSFRRALTKAFVAGGSKQTAKYAGDLEMFLDCQSHEVAPLELQGHTEISVENGKYM